MNAVDAVNYGAIGVVIGHEVSHGFDDQGAQFDFLGRFRNWWTEADLKRFQERGQCVVEQYEGYFIEPGIHHNGKLVLGESIGDLGGAKLAYLAYKKSLEGKPRPANLDGFSPEQQFFIAWGQFRGDARFRELFGLDPEQETWSADQLRACLAPDSAAKLDEALAREHHRGAAAVRDRLSTAGSESGFFGHCGGRSPEPLAAG